MLDATVIWNDWAVAVEEFTSAMAESPHLSHLWFAIQEVWAGEKRIFEFLDEQDVWQYYFR